MLEIMNDEYKRRKYNINYGSPYTITLEAPGATAAVLLAEVICRAHSEVS